MQNLKMRLDLVDGGDSPFDFRNGRELIQLLWGGDDFAAPPARLVIEATTVQGMKVTIAVSYDDRDRAYVAIS